jgi:hypothetical protein
MSDDDIAPVPVFNVALLPLYNIELERSYVGGNLTLGGQWPPRACHEYFEIDDIASISLAHMGRSHYDAPPHYWSGCFAANPASSVRR